MNSIIFDFLSADCKDNDHNHCASRWQGLGIEVACNCRCHVSKKGEALQLVGRPVGNASIIKGATYFE
jgi:hypothetical protein